MRYQIFSLQQKALVDLNLNVEEALLLDWFLNWKDGNSMKREYIEEVNDIGYWLNYENVIKELPILFKQPTSDMDDKALNKLLRNNKDKVARMLRGNLSKVLTPHKIVYKGIGARLGSMIFITIKRDVIDMLKNIEHGTNKKSPTCGEAEDIQKSKNFNVDNSIPQNEEKYDNKFMENKNENDYEAIAYAKCLSEIEGFEQMEQFVKDFHVHVMLRKIAEGGN